MGNPKYAARHYLPDDLGRQLRLARHRRRLSLREAAPEMGIDRRYLSRLERGERCPSIAVADALIYVLDLDEDTSRRLMEHAIPNVGHSR